MPRLVHFEIHTDNMERAAKFYTDIFGWEFKKWDGPVDYMMIMTGDKNKPGIDGGMVKRMGPPPAKGQAVNAFPCTIEIDNIDAYIEKVKNGGGEIVFEKNAIPKVGWLCYFADTEGNIVGLMQADENAA